jgi:hypothetical protein
MPRLRGLPETVGTECWACAPVRARVRSAFGLLQGRIVVRGNIIDPIEVAWNAST